MIFVRWVYQFSRIGMCQNYAEGYVKLIPHLIRHCRGQDTVMTSFLSPKTVRDIDMKLQIASHASFYIVHGSLSRF